METLVTIGYIAICVLFFSLAIAIHEFGHFIVALKLGLKVERFSIGFGPAIWKKTWRGVEYRISWIPLGGYVMIPDVDPEGTKTIEGGEKKEGRRPRQNLPAWKEIAVAVAGPGMNIVLAVVLACVLAAIPSVKFGELSAKVSGTIKGSPAAEAGIKEGDTVVSVGGKKVDSWSEMQVEVQIAGGAETDFVLRDDSGAERTVRLAPKRDEVSGMCYIGAIPFSEENGGASSWMPARNPLKQLAWDAGSIFRVLKGLVTPKESKNTAKALGGPQMIAENIYASVRRDFWDGVGFLRFLNVNLAVLNLLPIPVLDGGLIMFALFALVFRRRVPEKVVGVLSTVFMYLLLGAMAIIIFRDAHRSWKIHTYKPDEAETAIEEQTSAETNETDNASN